MFHFPQFERLWRAFVCSAFTAANPFVYVSAAAAVAPVAINAPEIPLPAIEKIPLKVGLCTSPALKTALIALERHEARLEPPNSVIGPHKTWELGGAALATLVTTTRAAFSDVSVLGDCSPDVSVPSDLQVVVAADLQDAGAQVVSGWFSRPWKGHIDIRLTLRAADTRLSLTRNVFGAALADQRESLERDGVAMSLSAALRNMSAQLLADLFVNKEVRSWLVSAGVPSELGRTDHTQELSKETASKLTQGRVAILSDGRDSAVSAAAHCVGKALESLDTNLRVIPAEQARDAFFPWLEAGVLNDGVAAILSSRMIRARADQADVQFIATLTGSDSDFSESHGPFTCGAAGEGFGCMGAAVSERGTKIWASVWDLQRGLQASLTGEGHVKDVVVGPVLPLWIPGGRSTKTLACRDMANTLLRVMRGDTAGHLSPIVTLNHTADQAANEVPTDSTYGCLETFANAGTAASGANRPTVSSPDASHDGDTNGTRVPGQSDPAIVDNVQWFDGVDSLAVFSSRKLLTLQTRIGHMEITDESISFASPLDSEGLVRLPLAVVEHVRVEKGATHMIMLTTDQGCHAAFQVLDRDPSAVIRRTDALGSLLTDRLAASRNRAKSTER